MDPHCSSPAPITVLPEDAVLWVFTRRLFFYFRLRGNRLIDPVILQTTAQRRLSTWRHSSGSTTHSLISPHSARSGKATTGANSSRTRVRFICLTFCDDESDHWCLLSRLFWLRIQVTCSSTATKRGKHSAAQPTSTGSNPKISEELTVEMYKPWRETNCYLDASFCSWVGYLGLVPFIIRYSKSINDHFDVLSHYSSKYI